MVAAVVFQAMPAGIGCWLESAGLDPVSTLIIITAYCNSHANHSLEQCRDEGRGVHKKGPETRMMGRVESRLYTECFQQTLIGPFIPTCRQNEPGQGYDWAETGGCAGPAAVRIEVTSEEGETVRIWLVRPGSS